MKTTIQLSGDLDKDIQRLEEIKAQITKERLDFHLREPKLRKQQRNNFFKRLFTTRDNPIEVRKKKLLKTLNSENFKKHFYGLQNIKTPLTWYQKLEILYRSIIHAIDERFRKKNHIELLMDRISLMDEMSLLEKRVKMAKYGIDPMLDRDLEDSDKFEMKNQIEELTSYRQELGDFLKNDSEYIKLKDNEKKMCEDTAKAIQSHNALWDKLKVEKKPGETDPRYDSFSVTLPDDKNYNEV